MKILNSFNLKPEQRQALEKAGHVVIDDNQLDQATAQQIDVVYGWHDQSAQVNFDHLRFVQAISAGVDYLPLADFAKHQVLLANTSGIHAEPIAEYVLGVLLRSAAAFYHRFAPVVRCGLSVSNSRQ